MSSRRVGTLNLRSFAFWNARRVSRHACAHPDAYVPNPHCSPHPHFSQVGGPSPTSAECYDLKVDVARALNAPNRPTVSLHAQQLFEKAVKGPDVGAADEAIRQAIRRIEEHKRRRAFFLAFSTSPAEFVNRVIASQARDLEIVTGPGVRAREAERRTEFYKQPWVEDAIMRYLQRATQAGAS